MCGRYVITKPETKTKKYVKFVLRKQNYVVNCFYVKPMLRKTFFSVTKYYVTKMLRKQFCT